MLMNYSQILENTIVPINLNLDEKICRYEKLDQYINMYLPKKLYRFRTVSERSLDQLYGDVLGFSDCSSMNDDFDARVCYDRNELDRWLKSFLTEENKTELFKTILNMTEVPKEIKNVIPNAEGILKVMRNSSSEKFYFDLENMIESFVTNFEEELKLLTLGVQESVKIACFTEKIDSAMMWGQYANNATGFALEYEFLSNRIDFSSNLNENYKMYGSIYPIDYSNRRIDATDYVKFLYQSKLLKNALMMNGIVDDGGLIRFAVPCSDEFMATKIALFKSKDWGEKSQFSITPEI